MLAIPTYQGTKVVNFREISATFLIFSIMKGEKLTKISWKFLKNKVLQA